MNNLGFTIKAIRKASTHLTEETKNRNNVAISYNKKTPDTLSTGSSLYRDKIYSDYSAFASSATFSAASAGASAFFVERRLRRVFLASAFGDLAIFSL